MANDLELKSFDSPIGNIQWVKILGEGEENLSGKMVYQASLLLPSNLAEPLITSIKAFYEEFKPKGTKKLKSLGYSRVKDAEGEETGYVSFSFWTGATWTPKGSTTPKRTKIKIFNAKGAEVQLGEKVIGNESRGRIGGAMGIYSLKTKESGVTLYLNKIQLTKFVEFDGAGTFDEVVDEKGEDFETADDGMSGVVEAQSEATETKATPRL